VLEDLTIPGFSRIQRDLELDLIADEHTATVVASYWLGRWKRPRWIVDLVAWQNVLALEKADHVAIANHPVLEAHGGAALVFRIVDKHYLLADENPARIQLTAIEANP
jgi:hypothetical protein